MIVEAMASCGFDWVAADMEHGVVSVSDFPALFAAIERRGAAPLVRLPSMDSIVARRALDAGAHGLLVPVVEDPSAFSSFARHCYYPPKGRRGVGLSRATLWTDEFPDYVEQFQPVLVPMIETRKGADAADALAALPETDGLFIGPYDLSADLGQPGNFTSPEILQAISAIKSACGRHKKAFGGHQVAPDIDQLRAKLDDGFGFVAFGTDILAMRHCFAGIKGILGCR